MLRAAPEDFQHPQVAAQTLFCLRRRRHIARPNPPRTLPIKGKAAGSGVAVGGGPLFGQLGPLTIAPPPPKSKILYVPQQPNHLCKSAPLPVRVKFPDFQRPETPYLKGTTAAEPHRQVYQPRQGIRNSFLAPITTLRQPPAT